MDHKNNDNGNDNDDDNDDNDDNDNDDDDDKLEIYDGNEFCIFPPTNNNNLTTTTTTKQNYNTSDNSSRRRGGYAIIGKNGCGKTLFAKSLIAEAAEASEAADGSDNGNNDSNSNPYVRSGQITINSSDNGNSDNNNSNNKYRHLRPTHPLRLKEEAKTKTTSSSSSKIKIAHVSFDSHRQLLEERDESKNSSNNNSSITAFKAIAKVGNAPGKLNKAAQFLVIRFGLYPLLHRQVNTLSTGEIRKVLLVRALSIKPNILLLDNAFDGLDISSRQVLCDIVSKTIKGFTNDILVQGIDSKDTNENTQVIIVTHRHEELNTIQEIDTIIYWDNKNRKNKNKDKQNTWNVVRRRRRPQRLCDSDRSNDDDIDQNKKDDDYHNDDDDDDDDDDNDNDDDDTGKHETPCLAIRLFSSSTGIIVLPPPRLVRFNRKFNKSGIPNSFEGDILYF